MTGFHWVRRFRVVRQIFLEFVTNEFSTGELADILMDCTGKALNGFLRDFLAFHSGELV